MAWNYTCNSDFSLWFVNMPILMGWILGYDQLNIDLSQSVHLSHEILKGCSFPSIFQLTNKVLNIAVQCTEVVNTCFQRSLSGLTGYSAYPVSVCVTLLRSTLTAASKMAIFFKILRQFSLLHNISPNLRFPGILEPLSTKFPDPNYL